MHYTNKQFWDSYYQKYQPKIVDKALFSDIFDKYLTLDASKTILEIGCGGGEFLCYLVKKFRFKAYGVDYSHDGIEKTRTIFKYNNLPEPTLYKENIFNWQADKKFDTICSFGFMEHFDDLNEVIKKHADLVAPGGTLIISMPNFSGAQYLFHWLIDRDNLKKHNTRIMNLKSIRDVFQNLPFKIKYLSYYQTFGFWTEKENLKLWEKIIYQSIRLFRRVICKLLGYNHPNPLFSPHIICVAEKKKE